MRVPVGSPPGPAGASSSFLPSPTSSRLGPEPPLSPPFPHPLCAIFQPRPHPSSDWHRRCWDATAGWDVFFFFLPVFCSVCPSCTKWRAFSICYLFWTYTLTPVGGKKSTTCLWHSKNWSWDLRVCLHAKQGCVKTQMHSRYFNYFMCIYANTNIHACLTMKKHSYCFDTEKHSHAHPVDAAFTRTVAALSHRTTHTKYSQHISALWGPSPFTQAGVSPRTFHTHADVLRQQRRRGGDAELSCNQPQRLIV